MSKNLISSVRLLLSLAIVLITLSNALSQDQGTISGTVVDADKLPLPGVSVVVEGTSKGTVTNFDGQFKIQADPGTTLIFSMVGMQSISQKIGNETNLSVTMAEESEILEEVVVTGFQEVNRKLFTGSAEMVKMKDIQMAGSTDVGKMLDGQVAGVSVENPSGSFGSSPKIRIRGNASINGNNQPLFVIDGVILEDLVNVSAEDIVSGNSSSLISSSTANLNPSDIESVQVLKDASATALYGARAANGVIVISTKKGKSGKLRVNYSGNFSVKLRPTYNQFNFLNSGEEMSVYRELVDKGHIDIGTSVRAQNYGAIGKMFSKIANHEIPWGAYGELNEDFLNQYENANTDWFDELFRDFGLQQQHSLSFSSGTEKVNNYYSISYLTDQGQTIADDVKRITGTAKNTYFISDAFTFGLKLSGSYRDQKAPGTRNRELDPLSGRYVRGFDINPFSFALNTSRSIRPRDENGDLEYFRRNYAPFNILEELEYNYMKINVADISAQADFEVRPVNNLSIKSVIQGRYASTNREHIVHERSNQAEAYRADGTQFIQESNQLLYRDPDNPGLNPVVVLPQGGFNYRDQNDLLNMYGRISADWNKKIGDTHEFNALGGAELRYTDRNATSTTGIGVLYENGGIVITDPNIIEFFNAQNIDYYSLNEERDRFFGAFLNGGYSYKSRYIANFTVRYDGSNQLGNSQQARYLPTWNVSGAWNAHNENFMSDFDFISDLKLRATYGLSGNLPPGTSALLDLRADVTVRPTDIEPYLYIASLTNTDLTWEKLKEFNVGLDVGLFDGRIYTTLNYYQRLGFDLVGIVQTSGIGGEAFKFGNFADLEAEGYEIAISTTNIRKKDFTWTSNFNLGYTRDEVTRLDFGPRLVDAMVQSGAAVLGSPKSSLYSAKFAGLDNQGIPQFFNEDGEKVYDIDLQQRNNLTEILKYEGPAEPRGAGGFTNTFTYKGLSLNVLLTYKYDYKIRLNDAFYPSYTDFDALPRELINRWSVPGDENITDIPAIVNQDLLAFNGEYSNAYNLYNKSDVRIVDGDHIRLKLVRLSYSFPPKIVDALKLGSLGLSAEGQNLALLYSDPALNGQDPEFISAGGVALPTPRLVTFSLNIGL